MGGDWTGLRFRSPAGALLLTTFFLVGSGISAAAQESGEAKTQAPSASPPDRRTLRSLPANFGRGIVGVFARDNLVPLVAGGVATGGAWALDADVRDAINPDPGEGWGQSLETAGGPVWSSAFVVSMFTAGRIVKNDHFKAMSYDLLDGAMLNVVYFQSLKLIVRRERPNGENNQAFPSGHTSNAFAIATVAEKHYGWKIGIPAYLMAATVGASRMKQDMHYFSDVVAGATLGYIVGRTVVRVNSQPPGVNAPRGASLNIAPIMTRRSHGVQMSVTF